MNNLTLVVLAAGMGNRYGGLKQIDRIGRNGEVLLDYSVYDAIQSGFKKIVFIIRKDFENDFNEVIISRLSSSIKCESVFQELDSLIPEKIFMAAKNAGRIKPWGTAHALLCAEDHLDAPFVVINADDFYGREAFQVMAKHLAANPAESAIVPYRLEKTLSPRGTVARGVCIIENDYLVSVDELMAIEKKEGQIFNTNPDGSIRELRADTPVSMNFWGFQKTILPEIRDYFNNYVSSLETDIQGKIKTECYLPMAADYLLKNRNLKIKALKADPDWFGVTYREDREMAAKKIGELTAAGIYPAALW